MKTSDPGRTRRAICLTTATLLVLVGWAGRESPPARAGAAIDAVEATNAAEAIDAAGPDWLAARPDYPWSFPRDHWPHSGYRTEWWYFTGHLRDPDGREYGFQFTVFQVGLSPADPSFTSTWATRALFMGHASITDVGGDRHVFSDVLHRVTPLLAGFAPAPDGAEADDGAETDDDARDALLAWSRGPTGTAELWTLSWNGKGFDFAMRDRRTGIAMDLRTEPRKPLVFQGPRGFSRKGRDPDAASLYYSFTRLSTRGWIELDGRRLEVQGESWMDKEFGSNQLADGQVGWDWFSLQLADGRDLMLYMLRREDGSVDFSRGTWIDADGGTRYLDAGEWSYRATGEWTSPRTGTRYPSGWRLSLPGLDLDLEVLPRVRAQENVAERSGGLSYWEGAVEVRSRGAEVGRGYVELTGYGRGNRPPI